MNPRITAAVAGLVILGLGLVGLLYPARVMATLGLAPLVPSQPIGAWGEVRATFGGVFTVMGAFVLWAALDPVGRRGLLRMAGGLWLGACGGRLLGVYADGGPGAWGWLSVGFEALIGTLLLLVGLGVGSPVAKRTDEALPSS